MVEEVVAAKAAETVLGMEVEEEVARGVVMVVERGVEARAEAVMVEGKEEGKEVGKVAEAAKAVAATEEAGA